MFFFAPPIFGKGDKKPTGPKLDMASRGKGDTKIKVDSLSAGQLVYLKRHLLEYAAKPDFAEAGNVALLKLTQKGVVHFCNAQLRLNSMEVEEGAAGVEEFCEKTMRETEDSDFEGFHLPTVYCLWYGISEGKESDEGFTDEQQLTWMQLLARPRGLGALRLTDEHATVLRAAAPAGAPGIVKLGSRTLKVSRGRELIIAIDIDRVFDMMGIAQGKRFSRQRESWSEERLPLDVGVQ